MSLDPCARAIYISSDDGSLYAVDLFSEKALLGPHAEATSTAIQVSSAFGASPQEAGPASCMALNYDGTILISGHPQGHILRWDLSGRTDSTELSNVNAAVTNIVFVSPLPYSRSTKPIEVVKPFMGSRSYNFTAQLDSSMEAETRFSKMLKTNGLPNDVLEQAILAFQAPDLDTVGDQELRKENEELWEVVNEQRALQKKTLQRYLDAKSANA